MSYHIESLKISEVHTSNQPIIVFSEEQLTSATKKACAQDATKS